MDLFFKDFSVAFLIKVISESLFSAKTNYDEKAKKIIVSVQAEKGESVDLKFWEDLDGYPVLIVSMSETSPGGKADKFYLWLTLFLQWKYKKKMPIVRRYDFKGYSFYDWQPNAFYPINVYLWNKTGMGEDRINRLILGS